MRNNNRNPVIIGFTRKTNAKASYHCAVHIGTALIQMEEESSLYRCPTCGLAFDPLEGTVKSETKISSRFATVEGKKKIVSGKSRAFKQKKYHDLMGNVINRKDPDIMNDIAQGHTIVSYNTTEDLDPKINSRANRTERKTHDIYI